jgi:hypothetical protein
MTGPTPDTEALKESSLSSTHNARSGINKISAIANNDGLKSDGSWMGGIKPVCVRRRQVQDDQIQFGDPSIGTAASTSRNCSL